MNDVNFLVKSDTMALTDENHDKLVSIRSLNHWVFTDRKISQGQYFSIFTIVLIPQQENKSEEETAGLRRHGGR